MLYKFKFYLLNATFRLEALEKSVSDSDVGSHQKDFVHFGLPPAHPPVGGGGWWLLGGMVVGGGDGGGWVWGVWVMRGPPINVGNSQHIFAASPDTASRVIFLALSLTR